MVSIDEKSEKIRFRLRRMNITAKISHIKNPYVKDIITPSGLPIAVDISKDAVKITHHTPDFVVTISKAGLKALEEAIIADIAVKMIEESHDRD